jgi:hypothetical protein
MRQCWFCGQGIDKTDVRALRVSASNLWTQGDDDPVQEFYLHSACAIDHFKGSSMSFDPDDLLNSN